MPPCGFNASSVSGALTFIRGCYEDLLEQVRSGKFPTYEEAIEFELKQIERALTQLHIDAYGNLVDKPESLAPLIEPHEAAAHSLK
jgi:hypothetical protein